MGSKPANQCSRARVCRTGYQVLDFIHYITSGADIITANTYASSALLFNALGRDDDLLAINRAAIEIARRAAEGKTVAIAASISTMRPMVKGSDRNNLERNWPEAEARRLFQRKIDGMAKAGADFLMLELLRDGDYAVWATEAALASGLPVWVGLSAERGSLGKLQGWGRDDWLFEDIVQRLAATGPAVISVMHTSPYDTDEALQIVRRYWDGPLGTYPESGYFKMPDWQFVDIITPADLVAKSKSWRTQGVTAFGGCCGIGPDHIAALSEEFKQ